jgi:hypothetical protein
MIRSLVNRVTTVSPMCGHRWHRSVERIAAHHVLRRATLTLAERPVICS